MNRQQIQEELSTVAIRELKLEGELSSGELADQLDSMQRLTLVVAIEDHFKICFDPDDEEQIRDVSDLVGLIHRKLDDR